MKMSEKWWDEKIWEFLMMLYIPLLFVLLAVATFVICVGNPTDRTQINERLNQIELRLETLEQDIKSNE